MAEERIDKIRSLGRTSILRTIQYSIDLLTATLLLTGQITTSGIYIVPNGFFLAGTGPIIGGARMKGISTPAKLGLDAVDVINAFLLILGQVRVSGPFFTSGRIYLVWTGEIFGLEQAEVTDASSEERQSLRKFIKKEMIMRNQ